MILRPTGLDGSVVSFWSSMSVKLVKRLPTILRGNPQKTQLTKYEMINSRFLTGNVPSCSDEYEEHNDELKMLLTIRQAS